jgi:hypothetical protein
MYRIKNVVTLFRRQFPGKQQCWCQIWPRKSGIHVHTTYIYMCGKFGAIRDKFFSMTWTKFDLTEMNPSRVIPGSAYTPLPSFVKLGPWTWEIYKCDLWVPNDLVLCRNKPLNGNSGVGLHTHTNPVKCVPEAPHNQTPIYPVNCVAQSDAPHKLTQEVCFPRRYIRPPNIIMRIWILHYSINHWTIL